MNYISLEALHTTRNIIGLIIFIIVFFLLLRKKSEFHKTLDVELMRNHYKKIYSRLMALEELNKRTLHLAKQMNTISDAPKDVFKPKIHKINQCPYPADENRKIAEFGEIDAIDCVLSSTGNNQEKPEIINCGISKSKVQKIMHMPKAEVDFMLKFNRLYQLNHQKSNHFAAKSSIMR